MTRLYEFRDAILKGDKRLSTLVPLLPEFFEKPDISVLHRLRELILAQNDLKRQAEAVFYTLAFGQRHFPEIEDNFSPHAEGQIVRLSREYSPSKSKAGN